MAKHTITTLINKAQYCVIYDNKKDIYKMNIVTKISTIALASALIAAPITVLADDNSNLLGGTVNAVTGTVNDTVGGVTGSATGGNVGGTVGGVTGTATDAVGGVTGSNSGGV